MKRKTNIDETVMKEFEDLIEPVTRSDEFPKKKKIEFSWPIWPGVTYNWSVEWMV